MTTRTALVGFGYWGRNLGRNIAGTNGLELVAIVDVADANRETAAADHPDVDIFEDWGVLLADDDIDAIALATPAASHADMAMRALEAGKHVFVEKPLAMTSQGGATVAERASQHGLVAMVGHTFLYSSPVRELRQLVEDGVVGKVTYLYSQRLNLGRIRNDCDALWNFAPHDVSIAMYLLGGEVPVEVSARGMSFVQPGINDVYFATMTFASGVSFGLHVSWVDPRKIRLMTVVGNKAMVVYDDVSSDRKLQIFDSSVTGPEGASFGEFSTYGDFQWRTRAGDIRIPRIELSEPLGVEMAEFADACATGRRPLTDAVHGLEVVRVLEAIEASAGQGGRSMEVRREGV